MNQANQQPLNFSRGQMKNEDWKNILDHINQARKGAPSKKKVPLEPFYRVEPFLYKEKIHGRKKSPSHENINIKEPHLILLCSDPGMQGVMETHKQATEWIGRSGGKGYIQKLFAKFHTNTDYHEFVYIGDVIIGVHPEKNQATEALPQTEKELKTEKEFA